MKSLKLRLIPVISLAAAALVALGTFFGLNFASAERSVTVSGSTVFSTSANAEVWSHEVVKTPAEGDTAVNDYFTMFVLKSDNDSVNYRKNLAYQWYYNKNEGVKVGEGDDAKDAPLESAHGLFNTVIGFETNDGGKLDFKRFIITFEGQQYSQSKDGKSVNYIIFEPTEAGTELKVLITDDKEAKFPETGAQTVGTDNIKIEFTAENEGGDFEVKVSTEGKYATGTFKNVGGTYARYSSSTTTPVTPLSFSAEFPEEEDGEENEAVSYARMVMYSLNGQSFKLKETPSKVDGHFRSGVISDDTPPVLCLDKGVSFIGHDKEISFNYTVIDVVTSSPSIETSYFMLTKKQVEEGTAFNANDYKADRLFTVVKDSDDQRMDPHVAHYIPDGDKTPSDYKKEVFDADMNVTAAVKVLLKLTDTTSTGGESTYVMLDWYVESKYAVTINDNNYIAVAEDNEGAYYKHTDKSAATSTVTDGSDWDNAVKAYQAEVTKAAVDLKAGNKNYFYLPSAKALFGDNATEYEDLTFSIYYISSSRQQETGKAANALSIPLNSDGKYIFTVFATDAQSNEMYYFKDGKKVEFGTGDIWTMYDDEDLKDYLPWFEFTVETTEISIEAPKEQDTAYVGSSYTPDSFEINGVSYNTTYSLYVFDSKRYFDDNNGETLSYSEFMDRKEELINDSENGRKWFTYIYPSSGLQEGTDVYEKYNDYQWNNSSLSFVPQDANTFYLIKCEVKGRGNSGSQTATEYMGIASAPKVNALEGEDTWVQDNMVSIILLCIAGASLVGIVLLLVIKPRNKGDLDEMETVKPSKKNK